MNVNTDSLHRCHLDSAVEQESPWDKNVQQGRGTYWALALIGLVDRNNLGHTVLVCLQGHLCCSNNQQYILYTQIHSRAFSLVSRNLVGMPVVQASLVDNSGLLYIQPGA